MIDFKAKFTWEENKMSRKSKRRMKSKALTDQEAVFGTLNYESESDTFHTY
jgi:hypothetical protein